MLLGKIEPDHAMSIAVLQADIYQVQNRLDVLARGATRDGGTPKKASKRRGMNDTIKSTTGEVEAIVALTSDPLTLRLRLSEHLCGLMMELECSLLQQTDQHSARPLAGLDKRVLTRLTPWSALVDRLLDLGLRARDSGPGGTLRGQQDAAIFLPPKEKIMLAGSAAHDCVEELQDLLDLLELDLSLDPDEEPASPRQSKNSEKDTLRWLEQATERLFVIQDDGIAPLLKERDRSRKHGELLRTRMVTLQNKSAENLKPVEDRSRELQGEVNAARERNSNAYRADEMLCEDLRKRKRELESQAREHQAAAGVLEAQGATKIAEGWKQLRMAEEEQVEVNRAVGDTAAKLYQQQRTLELQYAEDRACALQKIADLRGQLLLAQATHVEDDTSVSVGKRVEDTGEQDMVLVTNALLQQEMDGICATDDAGLRREASALEARNRRLRRSLEVQHLWARQAQKQRQLDGENMRRDLQLVREEQQRVELLLRSPASAAAIGKSDAMREMMQAETRALRAAFETRQARLEQKHDRNVAFEMEHVRVLTEGISIAREAGSAWKNKLKGGKS
jgi:hypothetical protein